MNANTSTNKEKNVFGLWVASMIATQIITQEALITLAVLVMGSFVYGITVAENSEKKGFQIFWYIVAFFPVGMLLAGYYVNLPPLIVDVLFFTCLISSAIVLMIGFSHSVWGIEKILGIPSSTNM